MIIELTLTSHEKHLPLALIDDKVMIPKKTPEKRPSEKAVVEVEESAKIESTLEFGMCLTWTSPPIV